MHDQLHHAYFSLQGLNPHCEYMPYTYMFSSKQERFEKRPLSFTWFMSTIFSWNCIKSLKLPIIHSYQIRNPSSDDFYCIRHNYTTSKPLYLMTLLLPKRFGEKDYSNFVLSIWIDPLPVKYDFSCPTSIAVIWHVSSYESL